MTENQTVAADRVVTMHYTLKLDDGQVVDSSSGREPLSYLHGHGNIVPGLEAAMNGKATGDEFEVQVAPEQGYGVRHEEAIHTVQRDQFPPGSQLEVNTTFQAQDENGQVVMGTVRAVEGDNITVDFNHPLAGQNLNFSIQITEIREASDEEKQHGHSHGPGGHDH